ncbi:SubName: Full=Probable GTP-binding protein rho2 {ECO:0000313/EMBL:CCA76026.1} [Serendipita indica DSM 11827]|nr:SubName: Full=Probable GTP-binding protein rho2 {ECO:0000313/EMBL:CCA76026.1} [Serendipita indica DSM 11827]
MSQRIRKKAVFVGDRGVGKTALIYHIHRGTYLYSFAPVVHETLVADVTVDGKEFEIATWDCPVASEYERLRPLSYPSTDVLVLCFSVDQPDSLRSLREMVARGIAFLRRRIPSIPRRRVPH